MKLQIERTQLKYLYPMTCMMVTFLYKKEYLNFLVKQDPSYYQNLNKVKAIVLLSIPCLLYYSADVFLYAEIRGLLSQASEKKNRDKK